MSTERVIRQLINHKIGVLIIMGRISSMIGPPFTKYPPGGSMSNSGRGRGFCDGSEETGGRRTIWLMFVNNFHNGGGSTSPPSQITSHMGESYGVRVKYLTASTSTRGNDLRDRMGYDEFICVGVSIRFHVPCWYYAHHQRKHHWFFWAWWKPWSSFLDSDLLVSILLVLAVVSYVFLCMDSATFDVAN